MTDKLFTTIRTPLNGANYHDWKFAVQMVMRHHDCWDVVAGTISKPAGKEELKEWEKKANQGLTIIGLSVDPSQYTYIRDAKDGVEAWQKLKDQYEKNTRATRISLKQQFYGYEHNTNLPIQQYIAGITDLAAKLKGIGIRLTDEEITDVMIFNLANEYSGIASTLMASKDELKVAEVSSALLEEERRKGGPVDSTESIALFGKARRSDGNHPHWGTGPPTRGNSPCFRCGRMGHKLKDCTAQRHANGGPITQEMEEEARKKISQFRAKSNFASYVAESLNEVTY